jgi:UDP-glucose 4-epimerase
MSFKKVLVTGSAGFIGSHVADSLFEAGYEVVLFDAFSSKYKKHMQQEFVGDINDIDILERAMDGCDAVFHFAAQADIGLSSLKPLETIKTNILGTQNILELAVKKDLKRVLFASTIYVYSSLGSFYRVSKQACEKLIEEYQKEFDLDYTILRYGSLYGPRANEFNFISNAILQAINERKIVRRGNGSEIREYIHVKDAANITTEALNKIYKNKHLIITGYQQNRVSDILNMIKEIFNYEIEIEYGEEKELHHYEVTPYSYEPKIAKKIIPGSHYDLGQGILEQIHELENLIKLKNGKNITLLKRKNDAN